MSYILGKYTFWTFSHPGKGEEAGGAHQHRHALQWRSSGGGKAISSAWLPADLSASPPASYATASFHAAPSLGAPGSACSRGLAGEELEGLMLVFFLLLLH